MSELAPLDIVRHQALISLRAYSPEGKVFLSDVAQLISKQGSTLRASSVFRLSREEMYDRTNHDLRNKESTSGWLAVVFKLQTQVTAEELLRYLKALEKDSTNERLGHMVRIKLLAYDQMTQMTPQMTLPDASFHLKPEELMLAAEIWGEFEHPVLKKSLRCLSQESSPTHWGDFCMQGKSLLDF